MVLVSSILCATIALAAPVPSHADSATGIDMVLGAMEDAIERRDIGAYMSVIDTSDQVWATEQRAWIADMATNPVEDVTVSRGWDSMLVIDDDGSARTTIEIVWHVPGEELDRSFIFDARFVPVGLADGPWLYHGRAWSEIERDTPGVVVYSDNAFDGLNERIAQRVPVIRENIEDALGVELDEDVSVKVYPDMASLQASIYLSYTDALSGWNEPGESIKILGRDGLDGGGLDTLLAHEIGHAVSFAMGEQIVEGPWWVLEGIAEVASDPFRNDQNQRTKRLVRLENKGDLRDWELLKDFRGEARNHGIFVYLQGWSMVRHIGEFYSVKVRNDWLRAMGAGESLDDATRQTIGISFSALDGQWRAMLASQFVEDPSDEPQRVDEAPEADHAPEGG